MQLIGDGTLSLVIPEEVIEAVEETVARMDGEAAQGPVKVTGRDLQQWNKVVCCVTVTANVYQTGTSARLHEMWR
jgi:methyl coenzyme M reductase beta subunit